MKYLKHIFLIFKIAVLIFSVGFIAYKIWHIPRLAKITDSILISYTENWILLVFVLFLLPFNLGIETLKWKILVSKLESFPIKNALKSVLAGISTSIFLPGRTGEFTGRIFTLTPGNRAKAIALSFSGNLSQLLLTLSLGITGLLFFHNEVEIPFFDNLVIYILLLSILITIMFFIYISPWIVDYILRLFPKTNRKFGKYFTGYYSLNKKVLITILVLSFLRYCVFTMQFFLALRLCNVDIPLYPGVAAIATVYLALAILPLATFNELAVRCSFSAIVIGILSSNVMGIIIASSLIWFINLAIPALIGNYFIWKTKNESFDLEKINPVRQTSPETTTYKTIVINQNIK